MVAAATVQKEGPAPSHPVADSQTPSGHTLLLLAHCSPARPDAPLRCEVPYVWGRFYLNDSSSISKPGKFSRRQFHLPVGKKQPRTDHDYKPITPSPAASIQKDGGRSSH